ncbi:MAG: hypothetical protein Q7U04_14245, partial [Bacteriovorax sp.]|nr:hypothetical protein [Bacteriovorax sp.]
MNSRALLTLISLLILSSCGSFENEKSSLLTKTESKDLVNTFDINKDQAALYKEKDPGTEVVPPVEVKPEVAPVQKTGGKKNKGKKLSKQEKIEIIPTSPAAAFSYPSDYPQDLKDYDAVSKSIWEKFKPMFFQGEQSIMSISYLGVTAGYITISSKDIVKINDKMAFHYYARFKSKDAYRYFYWLDDNIETFIEKSTFLPMKYSLIQREKKQNVDDLELFDYKKLK